MTKTELKRWLEDSDWQRGDLPQAIMEIVKASEECLFMAPDDTSMVYARTWLPDFVAGHNLWFKADLTHFIHKEILGTFLHNPKFMGCYGANGDFFCFIADGEYGILGIRESEAYLKFDNPSIAYLIHRMMLVGAVPINPTQTPEESLKVVESLPKDVSKKTRFEENILANFDAASAQGIRMKKGDKVISFEKQSEASTDDQN